VAGAKADLVIRLAEHDRLAAAERDAEPAGKRLRRAQ
jgi:hypothetical protein